MLISQAMQGDTRWGVERHSASTIKKAVAYLCARDPVLARLITRVGPCKWRVHRDQWRVLVESIISQQLSDKAAASISKKVQSATCVKHYPRATDFLRVDANTLRQAGLSFAKIKYLKDLAARVHSHAINFKKVARLSDEEVICELIKVKGIGRWTAEMFLMFSLGRMDVLPVGDLGIRRGFMKLYGFKQLPKPRTMTRLAQKWRPYRSVACWYLWQS